jgi:hypothetical protein
MDADSGGLIAQMFPGGNRPRSGQRNVAGWYSAFNPWTWALTINSTEVDPTFAYGLGAASAGGLPAIYGVDLAWQNNGTAILYNQQSPFGVNGDDDAILCQGTGGAGDSCDMFECGLTDWNVRQSDIHLEVLFQYNHAAGGAGLLLGKKNAAGVVGWDLRTGSSGQVVFYTSNTTHISLARTGFVAGNWYYISIFINRDEGSTDGSRMFRNGDTGGSGVDFSAHDADLNPSDAVGGLGGADTGTYANACKIGMVAMHLSTDWFQDGAAGPAEWADIHKERYWRLCGILPQIAPSGDELPTFTRSTTKYFHRSSQTSGTTVHLGGAGLLVIDDDGLAIHAAATNLNDDSDCSGWTKLDAGDVLNDDAVDSPMGVTQATTLVADSTDGNHYLGPKAPTFTAAQHVCWALVKKGAVDFWAMIFGSTVSEGKYFDLANGTVEGDWGSTPDASGIIDYGSDWYLCYIVSTLPAGATNVYVGPAAADGDLTFAGDGAAVSVNIAHVQVELGNYPTPPIVTAGATATRNADALTLHADIAAALNTAGQGTVECEFKLPNADITTAGRLFYLSDGTASSRVDLLVASADQEVEIYISDNGVQQYWFDCGSDVSDGAWHKVSVAWRSGRVSLIVDGTAQSSDAAGTIPSNLTSIYIGSFIGSSAFLNGHIRNLRIFDRPLH